MSSELGSTDVLIIGGGPVGLLTAYALQRMNISTCIVEPLDKNNMPMYGRACTLFPRTLEMLDQLELLDEFNQVGLIGRSNVNYDKNGQRVTNRGWQHLLSNMHGTFLDYFLNIRLKYSERLIQDAYEQNGGKVLVGWELREFSLDSKTAEVSAVVGAVGSKEVRTLRSKYIIGADGGRSKLRHLSGIPFIADNTTYRWVRIDGVVKTDMPDSRIGVASIESPTHGNVLWVPLDHCRTRIGFALSAEMYEKYGEHLTEAQAVEEAIASVAPFSLEFETVDWFTLYNIQQGVAENYIRDNCVILAGDACHTHSSGTAQGMNTGVHDAVNLAWKLGGILRGWYKKDVLQTYEEERRPIAQELIRQDKDFSTLISGDIPDQYKGTHLTPDALLAQVGKDYAQFVVGLGIHYEENMLNLDANAGTMIAGWRAPDVLVLAPGSRVPVRLQTITPNTGSFWVIVFTGEPLLTGTKLRALRSYLDSSESFTRKAHPDAVKFLTVIEGMKAQGEESLGVKSFGKVYYDPENSAHSKYGFTSGNGGIAVVRPDGIFAFATMLDKGNEIGNYFLRFIEVIAQL
ncbi:related to 2-polyprenyl-6-methoxyphenol hydroxylase and related FAD-dependent oxidoreductases [Phialocephala subalpina]|uniref:Related to 2-polyprenyl-6-methoxyphenol hydroxylase and related FAD-dependent oxidoreductases n=1 Tax=Phialocephala subalpina TaxID=576137 RepID=A0A1L7XTK9_9HELO|nr:related to 2-polyprenyl-6-methoxyphenol hydroxylase and related FAD-dependent oxidoreductases [Phialocephala subalpina]